MKKYSSIYVDGKQKRFLQMPLKEYERDLIRVKKEIFDELEANIHAADTYEGWLTFQDHKWEEIKTRHLKFD